jgi:FMN phosphatase YigB (HAD superfamily)
VRALLLDLGNVLVTFDHAITLRRMERATGVGGETLRLHLFDRLAMDLDRGLLTFGEFTRLAEKSVGVSRLDDHLWISAWRDIFTPIEKSLGLLSRLRADVSTVLVSNTNALHWEGVLHVAPVDRLVDALALSFEVGAAKPDRAIFDAALAKLGPVEGTPAFADDRPDYVAAARILGLDAFVVDSPATLERELRSRDLVSDELFGGEREGEPGEPFFEMGLGEFRKGRFFEAHEEWEALWKTAVGRDKVFLQGLIQLAAGLVHVQRGGFAPAERLFALALEKLETFRRNHAGLPIREICKELRTGERREISSTMRRLLMQPPI